MRHNVAPGVALMQHCDINVTPGSWPTGPPTPTTTQTINYKRRVKRRAARHTASLYASPGSAFHALLCALRAQRVAETELGMQLRYTPRSAPLRAAQLRCANGWIKDSSVLSPPGDSSLVVFPSPRRRKRRVAEQPALLVAPLPSAPLRGTEGSLEFQLKLYNSTPHHPC